MNGATLDSAMQGEIACAEALLGSLRAEHAALLDNDIEQLRSAGESKLQALQRLEACARARALLPGGNAGAGSLWDPLLDAAARCRDQNQTNAALLDARRARTLWALRYLGVSAPLYGRNGQTPSLTPQRVLARG